jgi:hypothetical protein
MQQNDIKMYIYIYIVINKLFLLFKRGRISKKGFYTLLTYITNKEGAFL